MREQNANGVETANLLTGLGLDEIFTRTDSSGTMGFLTDAIGSTYGLVNSSGSLQTTYTYGPFGGDDHLRHQRQYVSISGAGFPYGQAPPDAATLLEILIDVYTQLPIL